MSLIREFRLQPYDANATRSISTAELGIDANISGTYYAVLGIRLKGAELDSKIIVQSVDLMTSTGDNFAWELRLNPSVGGTFTFNDIPDSVAQGVIGDQSNNPSQNVVTLGDYIASGYVSDRVRHTGNVPLNIELTAPGGTPDELILCVTPTEGDNNLDIFGAINWAEEDN